MKIGFFAKWLGVAALAALVEACNGSGGTSSAIAPLPSAPAGTQSNALTTYSVFTGTIGTQAVIDIEPLGAGAASNIGASLPVRNGWVVYPDSSLQQVDVLGNFDAAQSMWALENVNILLANPNSEPTVDVFAVASGNPPPEEVSVNAYAPGGPLVAAGAQLSLEGNSLAATAPDLTHVTVFPQSASMIDNRTKMFHAIGKDSDGSLAQLSKAAVVWSLGRGSGCGVAAGKLKTLAADASTVLYIPPASGSSTANCPDQVIATVASGATSQAGSANAFYYDPSTFVRLAGIIKTTTGAPAANAIVNLYGASAEAQKGTFLLSADANGKFSRSVPLSRILAPTAALTADKTKSPFVALSPASINPVTAGAALANQTWTMTAQPANVAPKPQPPYEDLVRDADYFGNAARDSFPFGAPNGGGQFAAGSIEYILAHPGANATGASTSGPYAGYSFKWDAGGKVATFTQPGSGATRVLAVTIGATQVNGQPCPGGAACFSYARKIGSALDIDGAWSQTLSGTSFTTLYIRNEYNAAHQVAGSPIYSHTISTTQVVGSQSLKVSDQKFNASKKSLGTEATTRVAGSGNVLYTYSGTAHKLSYKADGTSLAVDYSIGAGTENKDYSGSFKLTVTGSPSAGDIGDAVNFAIPTLAATNTNVASGSVDGVGLAGLVSGHAASFTIAQNGKVTLTKDASPLRKCDRLLALVPRFGCFRVRRFADRAKDGMRRAVRTRGARPLRRDSALADAETPARPFAAYRLHELQTGPPPTRESARTQTSAGARAPRRGASRRRAHRAARDHHIRGVCAAASSNSKAETW